MAKVVIFDWDLGKVINEQAHFANLLLGSLPAQVALDTANVKLFQAVAHDPLLHQQIVDICKQQFTQAATAIRGRAQNVDSLLSGKPATEQVKAIVSQLRRDIETELDGARRRAEQLAQQKWESLTGQKAQYRAYKRDMAVKVTLGSSGTGLAAWGVALAVPTGGISLILSIVGLWRAAVDGVKILVVLVQEAETVEKDLNARMETLGKRYRGDSRTAVASKEMLASMLNTLTQLDFSNIAKVQEKCDLWANKLAGIRVQAHQLAVTLDRLLEASELLDRQLAAVAFPDQGRQAKLGRAVQKSTDMHRSIRDMLESERIPSLHVRAERGLEAHGHAKQALDALRQKSPGWTVAFDKWSAIAFNVALAGAGYTKGYTSLTDILEPKRATEWAQTGLSLASDLSSTINDMRS